MKKMSQSSLGWVIIVLSFICLNGAISFGAEPGKAKRDDIYQTARQHGVGWLADMAFVDVTNPEYLKRNCLGFLSGLFEKPGGDLSGNPLASQATCSGSASVPKDASGQAKDLDRTTGDVWLQQFGQDEPCVSKLGPKGKNIIACMEKYSQTLKAGGSAPDCINDPSLSAEQKAAAAALLTANAANLMEKKLIDIDEKLENGQLSPEDLQFLDSLRQQMQDYQKSSEAKEDPEKAKQELQANIGALKSSGAEFDEKRGWDFSKFDFNRLSSGSEAEYDAIRSVFGPEAADGLKSIYADHSNAPTDGSWRRPVTVVLGNMAVVPRTKVRDYGNRVEVRPEAVPVSKYEAEVSETFKNLMNESRNYLQAAHETNSTWHGVRALGRAINPARLGGADVRTSAEQKLVKSDDKIRAHFQQLEYGLGLDKQRLREMNGQLGAIYKESFNDLQSATQKLDKIEAALEGTVKAAFIIVATGGYGLAWIGTGMAITGGMAAVEAVAESFASSSNGGGSFFCNLGHRLLDKGLGTMAGAHCTAMMSMAIGGLGSKLYNLSPRVAMWLGRTLGAGAVGFQIAGSIDQWKEANKLSNYAKALRASGRVDEAEFLDRQAALLKTGAIVKPAMSIALMAYAEYKNYQAQHAQKEAQIQKQKQGLSKLDDELDKVLQERRAEEAKTGGGNQDRINQLKQRENALQNSVYDETYKMNDMQRVARAEEIAEDSLSSGQKEAVIKAHRAKTIPEKRAILERAFPDRPQLATKLMKHWVCGDVTPTQLGSRISELDSQFEAAKTEMRNARPGSVEWDQAAAKHRVLEQEAWKLAEVGEQASMTAQAEANRSLKAVKDASEALSRAQAELETSPSRSIAMNKVRQAQQELEAMKKAAVQTVSNKNEFDVHMGVDPNKVPSANELVEASAKLGSESVNFRARQTLPASRTEYERQLQDKVKRAVSSTSTSGQRLGEMPTAFSSNDGEVFRPQEVSVPAIDPSRGYTSQAPRAVLWRGDRGTVIRSDGTIFRTDGSIVRPNGTSVIVPDRLLAHFRSTVKNR